MRPVLIYDHKRNTRTSYITNLVCTSIRMTFCTYCTWVLLTWSPWPRDLWRLLTLFNEAMISIAFVIVCQFHPHHMKMTRLGACTSPWLCSNLLFDLETTSSRVTKGHEAPTSSKIWLEAGFLLFTAHPLRLCHMIDAWSMHDHWSMHQIYPAVLPVIWIWICHGRRMMVVSGLFVSLDMIYSFQVVFCSDSDVAGSVKSYILLMKFAELITDLD